jgi:cobalt-zinc-cadmium efflux system protein
MAKVEGVISVHDLHVWSLTERIALSAHVLIGKLESWPET